MIRFRVPDPPYTAELLAPYITAAGKKISLLSAFDTRKIKNPPTSVCRLIVISYFLTISNSNIQLVGYYGILFHLHNSHIIFKFSVCNHFSTYIFAYMYVYIVITSID